MLARLEGSCARGNDKISNAKRIEGVAHTLCKWERPPPLHRKNMPHCLSTAAEHQLFFVPKRASSEDLNKKQGSTFENMLTGLTTHDTGGILLIYSNRMEVYGNVCVTNH